MDRVRPPTDRRLASIVHGRAMPIRQFPDCDGVSLPGAGDQLGIAHTVYRRGRMVAGWFRSGLQALGFRLLQELY